ncbi:MAG TPA: phosphodiesterase [Bacilli bacterium]|nr:phosphodiesterase [Bacilli bacterium]
MFLKIINWSDGALVFVSILAILITVVLAIIVFYRFRRDYRNYRDEMTLLIDGALSKNEIVFSITSHISKIPKDMSFSLMLLSFDKFDEVISIFGEREAQKILERFVSNIDRALPQKVQIGRYSKDEFLISIRSDYSRAEIMRLAERIKEAGSLPIKVAGGAETNQHVSIGIAYYPYHGRNFKQLFNSLNLALYIAKREGGDSIVLYSDEMGVQEGENVRFYDEIKEAIDNKQFMLYYQPIIDVENNSVYGAEALLRWQHPEYGVLSPNKFIHIIEQSGDINWVGNWGIECLIKEFLQLKKMFPSKHFQLSMNLSPKQLANENLIMNFQNLIKKYRVLAKNITLEIIEFAIFEKHDIVRNNLTKLKELGFQIAVDGFAMDHTILEKIGSLPLDIIKLDRDFLQEDEDSSFLKTRYAEMLIEFAEKNEKLIICEGIENVEMMKKAGEYKINLLQGFYFSKPIAEEEFHRYLYNEKGIKKLINPPDKIEEPIIEESSTEAELEEKTSEEVVEATQNSEEIVVEAESKATKKVTKKAKEEKTTEAELEEKTSEEKVETNQNNEEVVSEVKPKATKKVTKKVKDKKTTETDLKEKTSEEKVENTENNEEIAPEAKSKTAKKGAKKVKETAPKQEK